MSTLDYDIKLEDYLNEVMEPDLLEYAKNELKFNEDKKSAYGILLKTMDDGVSSLTSKQATFLYKNLIEPINKKCITCGNIIEPYMFNDPESEPDLCSYHEDRKDKD